MRALALSASLRAAAVRTSARARRTMEGRRRRRSRGTQSVAPERRASRARSSPSSPHRRITGTPGWSRAASRRHSASSCVSKSMMTRSKRTPPRSALTKAAAPETQVASQGM